MKQASAGGSCDCAFAAAFFRFERLMGSPSSGFLSASSSTVLGILTGRMYQPTHMSVEPKLSTVLPSKNKVRPHELPIGIKYCLLRFRATSFPTWQTQGNSSSRKRIIATSTAVKKQYHHHYIIILLSLLQMPSSPSPSPSLPSYHYNTAVNS